MSKKVHELAKELDRSSKEVIAALAEKNVEVKSHMSVLTEEQESMAKKALAPKKAEAAKAEETASKPEGAQSAPPKKKKIIAVYNAHTSQTGIRPVRRERVLQVRQQPVRQQETQRNRRLRHRRARRQRQLVRLYRQSLPQRQFVRRQR